MNRLTWYCQCNSVTHLWVCWCFWLISSTAVHTTMRRFHRWDFIVLSCAVILFVVFIPAVLPVSCLLYVTCESDRLSSEHTSIRMNMSYRFGSLCEMSKNTLHFIYIYIYIYMWPWTTKPVISNTGIFVAVANNTLYGSKLLIFLLCQKSLGY